MPSKAAVTVQQQSTDVAQWNKEQLDVLRDAIAPDLNPTELQLFGLVAARSGLDPFAKQIYAIKRQGKVKFQTSIDGYRSIAARTGQYDGQDEPAYDEPCPCGERPPHPKSATVAVYRKDIGRAIKATAHWHEYKPDAGQSGQGDVMWRRMPHVMLAKVAEAAALRKAFPYVMADIYTAEEMEQSENGVAPVPSTPALTATTGKAEPPPSQPVEAEPGQESAAASATAVDSDAPRAYEGKVVVPLPDTVKERKRPDWLTTLPPEATVAKTELKMIVGRSKHTAILLGDLAFAVQAAGLQADDTVRVTGIRVEYQWQEGMPTRKELRFVTKVEVLRDGGYQELTSPQTTLTEEWGADAAPTDGDFTELAAEVFGADAKPAPTIDELLTLPPASDTAGVVYDGTLTLLSFENKHTRDGAAFTLIKATDNEHLYSAVMADDEASVQLVEGDAPRYAPGERARLVGTWVSTSSGDLILLTVVEPA